MDAPVEPQVALRIELLGGFRVTVDSRAVADSHWRSRKARNLVKMLALAPQQQLHREQIIDALWPEMDVAAGANNLRYTLHVARRVLEPKGTPSRRFLVYQNDHVALSPSASQWIDVVAFEKAARSARHSSDLVAVNAAIVLYAGELLPHDPYDEWLVDRRNQLQEMYLVLLRQLSHVHEGRGELLAAVDAMRQAVAIDPTQEANQADLIRLYALAGQRSRALLQYHRLRDVLQKALDVEPSKASKRLYEDILAGRLAGPGTSTQVTVEVALHPLRDTDGACVGHEPVSATPRTAFVGRELELDTLRSGLASCRTGRGNIVLVAGEPGIGKTRLAEQLVVEARRLGVMTLWGRCHEDQGAPAYWPWIQIIRAYLREQAPVLPRHEFGPAAADIVHLVPEAREYLPNYPAISFPRDPEQARFQLLDSVARFLETAASRQPLVLLLDDLHWADHSSLRLLDHLAPALGRMPLLIIGTYRDTEIQHDHPLNRTRAELSRQQVEQRLYLRGLSHEDVAQLIVIVTDREPSSDMVRAIHERTSGNPFFVGEIIRLLKHQPMPDAIAVPERVKDVIRRRLEQLSDESRRLLSVAAVIGRQFDLRLLERVGESSGEELLDLLDSAFAARILEDVVADDGRLSFAHALIQETLYEELSPARRMRLHGQIGVALERQHEADLDLHLAEVAHHFLHAASSDLAGKAIHYATRAGQQAMSQTAYTEAVVHLRHALEHARSHPKEDDGQFCDILLDLALAHHYAGNPEEARRTFSEAATLARRLCDGERLARAALGYGGLSVGLHSGADRVALLEEALALVAADAYVLRSRLLARLARHLQDRPETNGRGRSVARQSLELAQCAGDPSTIASALDALIRLHYGPDSLDDRTAQARELVRIASAAADRHWLFWGYYWLLDTSFERGDGGGFSNGVDLLTTLADELRSPTYRWLAFAVQAWRATVTGRIHDGEQLVRRMHREVTRSGSDFAEPYYLFNLFTVRREQGCLEELVKPIRNAIRQFPNMPFANATFLAWLYSEIGRDDEARSELERFAADEFAYLDRVGDRIIGLTRLAEAAVYLGELGIATRLYDLLSPYADFYLPHPHFGGFQRVSFSLGRLATTCCRWDDAERHFDDTLAADTAAGFWTFVARDHYAYAEMLVARGGEGDATQAADRIGRAASLAQRCGLSQLLTQATTLTTMLHDTTNGCHPASPVREMSD